VQVSRWGNSLAIRLPRLVVEALNLKPGDEIEVTVAGVRRFEISRDRSRDEAVARLRKYRGRLPAGFRFDRDDANARG
jgi:antitoxin MazE